MFKSHHQAIGYSKRKTNLDSISTVDGDTTRDESGENWSSLVKWDAKTFPAQNFCPYCPKCARVVNLEPEVMVYQSSNQRNYLVHSHCQISQTTFTQFSYFATKCQRIQIKPTPLTKIGARELYMTLTISHPLNAVKFFQSSQKIIENSQQYLYQIQNRPLFEPNTVILPMKQLAISVKYQDILENQLQYDIYNKINFLKFQVNLSEESAGLHIMEYKEGAIRFRMEFQIISEIEEKNKVIEGMNFKYRYANEEGDILKFNRCVLVLEEDTESKPREQFEKTENQQIFQYECEDDYEFASREFINSIKTQVGSKEFQKNVKKMTSQEIQKIVMQILPNLEQIILDDYGNYMFQSLIGCCNLQQRMTIIHQIKKKLNSLICEQQGTFVFQQLITHLTNVKQFQCLCDEVAINFNAVATDNYGNHFLRKLIAKMPAEMIEKFMPMILKGFVEFSKNKNAVCVMKCVLKALREGEEKQEHLSAQTKKILDILALNTQELINNEFGNYIIQEAYMNFKIERLIGITEFIVNFFYQNSCEKYSSNVVRNCVKQYWRGDINIYRSLKSLNNKKIISMSHNRDGNKVLLQILQLPFELAIKDKIISCTRNDQFSTEFNNRELTKLTKKGKTGAVGTKYTSFSEAYNFTKKQQN